MDAALLSEEIAGAAPFQVGGSLLLSKPITLFFEDATGTPAQLKFPLAGTEPTELQGLLQACKPASFGKGPVNVLDPNYRKALQLSADQLATNLNLPTFDMLHDVHRLLMPQARSVRAEPYRLNIYGPDCFFKSHIDTPRAADMFGSLVLCLPTEFSGGQLVIRSPNQATSVTHDWGSSMQPAGSSSLQWAAFYSDCEHEILPVTVGYRVTLTYNLYQVPWRPAAGSSSSVAGHLLAAADVVGSTAFGRRLVAGLRDSRWFPSGGKLAFALEHHYSVPGCHALPVRIDPAALKGSDLLLYQAAMQLKLRAKLVPVLRLHGLEDGDNPNQHPAGSFAVGAQFGMAPAARTAAGTRLWVSRGRAAGWKPGCGGDRGAGAAWTNGSTRAAAPAC